MLAYPVIAHNPTTDAVADEDHSPAHRLAEDQVVKSRHAVQLVGRHLKKLGQVADALVRHPAPASLNDLQRINTDGAFLRVLMNFRFYLLSLFFSQHGCAQGVATGRQGDWATGRQGESDLFLSPSRPVALSPFPLNDLHQPIQNLRCPGSPADRGPSRRD